MSPLDILILFLFFLSQFALFLFGIHYFFVIRIYQRNRERYRKENELPPLTQSPMVTIQVPIFNEKFVIKNVINSLIELDYPKESLQIQILDDSTDETVGIVRNLVEEVKNRGFNIDHIYRQEREDFKAGALNNGLKRAKGEYIAVFDADFIPDKLFLKETIPYFLLDNNLGCIQTRWGHQNPQESLLTRTIALGIDGHFIVEQNVRSTLNVINFNGTCGVWRKQCIADSGGWDGKILAEDLDLSYRAHINGWNFKYLQNTVCKGELPSDIQSFKLQQYRWAKGSTQSARKNLAKIWKSNNFGAVQKIESTFHHFGYFIQFFMFLLLITSVYLIDKPIFEILSIGLIFAVIAIAAPSMYVISALELNYSIRSTIYLIFYLTILGAGISYNTGYAAFSGLFQREGEFKRTPKKGNFSFGYLPSFNKKLLLEILLMLLSLYGIINGIALGRIFVIPFLLIFFLGFLWVTYLSLKQYLSEVRINLAKKEPVEIKIMN